ncbi:MAG: GtrA family protein [Acidobacteria bacterium]|nr:GtrA family protein [Acidobacteriota bacterium]
MRLLRRWMRYNAVGVTGIAVQLAVLAMLTRAGYGVMAATAVAVEASVLHNFHLHVRWTWRDRGLTGAGIVRALIRFHLTNGATSICGNLGLMALFAGVLGLPPIPANALAISVLGVVNFLIADRIAFAAETRQLVRDRSI